MGMEIILKNRVSCKSVGNCAHVDKKSHFSLRDCKERECFPHGWWKCLLNQHLPVHTALSIKQIAQSSISLTVFFGKDYSSAEVIPSPGPRKKKKRINTDYLHTATWFIFIKCLATDYQGSMILGVWLKIKSTKNGEKECFPKKKNVLILKYCIYFRHLGEPLHSQKRIWSVFISQIYAHV